MAKLRMSWPNRITVARILLIVPFVIVMLRMNDQNYGAWPRYSAICFFIVMAMSDAIDGWLARRNHDETSLGRFLDPMADKLLITCACLLLVWEKTAVQNMKLPDVVVVLIVGKDVYITLGFTIIYLITSEVKIEPGRLGRLSTALQLAMVMAVLISPDVSAVWAGFKFMVAALWWSAAAMAVVTVIAYTRNGTRFLNEFEHRRDK